MLVWRACARKPEQHQRQHAGVVDRPEERDVAQEIERRQHEQNRRDREQLQMSRNASVNECTKGAEGRSFIRVALRRPTPSCVRMSAAKRPISGVDDGRGSPVRAGATDPGTNPAFAPPPQVLCLS